MVLEKENVIERIKEAKEQYGLNYSQLAREINVQPISLYQFINGTYNLSKPRQLQALVVVENYIEQEKEKLRVIDHRGLCVR